MKQEIVRKFVNGELTKEEMEKLQKDVDAEGIVNAIQKITSNM